MGILALVFIVLSIGISIGFLLGFSRSMREAARDISQQNPSPPKFLPKLFIILGCGLLVAALAVFFHTWHFTRNATRTTGTVVELRESKDKYDGSISYAPVFRFRDSTGTEQTITSSLSQRPAGFEVGESVPVLYRTAAPNSARIDSFSQVWGPSCLLAIFGAVQLLIGSSMLFKAKPGIPPS